MGGKSSSRSMSSERWCRCRGGSGAVMQLVDEGAREGWEGLVRGSVEVVEERLEWRWPMVGIGGWVGAGF